jgi:hypothetical protein
MLKSPPSLLATFAAFISLQWLMNLVSSWKRTKNMLIEFWKKKGQSIKAHFVSQSRLDLNKNFRAAQKQQFNYLIRSKKLRLQSAFENLARWKYSTGNILLANPTVGNEQQYRFTMALVSH